MAEGFTIVDNRVSARAARGETPIGKLVTRNLRQEMSNLRAAGYTMPKSPVQADAETERVKAAVNNRTLTSAMRKNASMSRTASNMQIALPKIRQPLSSLEDKGIPYDTSDPGQLSEIRRWARIFYATHDLVPLLVDIYSKFPLVGLEFTCSKDSQIQEFYQSMFMDTLDYETFLPDLAREYWISGEVTSLAHFSESLGVWESEEILNPDMVAVSKSLFQKTERVQLVVKPLVDALREGASSVQGLSESERLEKQYEYEQLRRYYPEIIHAADREDGLDISDVLVSRIVNKTQPWDRRGTPHMLRSFRALMMEESLNAAQDAVADRLYSPFILATLGVPDLGDGQPWIPDQQDLDAARDDMQMALAADFRLMVHNFGLKVESVFGREAVPRFDQDYDRINSKLLQAWGIGESLISGGSGGPYASSALNREFITQMMVGFQNAIKRHIKKRCEIVAEAQEHYDFESSGGVRKVVYREIVERDEESGEERIVKVPKLLLPEVSFSSMNLRDEAQERAFLTQLKQMGVPISDKVLAVNIPIEFEEQLEAQSEEQVQKLVAQAQAMKKAYDIIMAQGLPIPPEMASFLAAQQQLAQATEATTMAQEQADQAAAMGEYAEETAGAQAEMAVGQAEMMQMQMQMMGQPQSGMPQPTDNASLTGPSGPPPGTPQQAPPGAAAQPGAPMQMAASNGKLTEKFDNDTNAKTKGFTPLTETIKPLPMQAPSYSEIAPVFPPTNPTAPHNKHLTEENGQLVEKLPRPKNQNRPAESDEQRANAPRMSRIQHGPAHMKGKTASGGYTVSELVHDPGFYEPLGHGGYMGQILADLPSLEALYERELGDPGFRPNNESYKILRELLEHHVQYRGGGHLPDWN